MEEECGRLGRRKIGNTECIQIVPENVKSHNAAPPPYSTRQVLKENGKG
jgi:hypothetical protein